MKKYNVVFFVFEIMVFILCLPVFAQTNQVEVSTYYPCPRGTFEVIALDPIDTDLSGEPDSVKGTLYFRDNDKTLQFYDGTGWHTISSSTSGYWKKNAAETAVYPEDLSWNISIGEESPENGLQICGSFSRHNSSVTDPTQVNLGVGDAPPGLLSETAGKYSGVCGGYLNKALFDGSVVGGGINNSANSIGAAVAGGLANEVTGQYSLIAGGCQNTAGGDHSFILGGTDNIASGTYSFITGGSHNEATGDYSFIFGGSGNDATSDHTFILGGRSNEASASYAIAGGWRAKAINPGSFVWGDSRNQDKKSNKDNSFFIYSQNGIYASNRSDGINPATYPLISPKDAEYPLPFDIAEFMAAAGSDALREGNLVAISGYNSLRKTKEEFDPHLIGVISGKRTTTIHLGNSKADDEDLEMKPVALAGRCYVKVNDQGGDISLGDPVTSSFKPGIGMKAKKSGMIIGYALESAEFSGKKEAEILVFVSPGEYFCRKELEALKEKLKMLRAKKSRDMAIKNEKY